MNNVSVNNPSASVFIDDFSVIDNTNFWSQPATTTDESKELLDAYYETFHETTYDSTNGYNFGLTKVLLPYLPYFSNCFTFDSYIPIWLLLEGQECILPDNQPRTWHRYNFPALVDHDQIKVVGPFDFFEYPVADWCVRNLTCNYEEQLSATGGTNRWFEQATGSALFHILRSPVNYYQYTGRSYTDSPSIDDGGGARVIDLYAARSPDNFIPVVYDHTAGDSLTGCSTNCFGRQYTLEITYYQITKNEKKIIYAALIGSNYDFNAKNTEYQLNISYFALGWLDLVLNFAFDYSINSVLNIIIGIGLIVFSALIWVTTRLTTHLRTPPPLRLFDVYILFFPPILSGFFLALVPIFLLTSFGNYIIYGVFISNPQNPTQAPVGLILDSFPSTYNSLGLAIASSSVSALRDQRVGTMFCVIGWCCFFSASKLYFCKPETKREREIAKLRTALAHREHEWHPVLWRASNFIFTSYIESLVLTMLVEVSLWSSFSNYQFFCVTIIFLMGLFSDEIFFLQVQDDLLAAPLNTAYGFIGQLVTFGANNYLLFVLSYVYGISIAVFSRLFLETYINIFFSTVDYTIDGFIALFKAIIPRYIYERSRVIVKLIERRNESKAKQRFIERKDPQYGNKDTQHNIDEQADSIEPLIGTYSAICNDMVILCYFPYMIYLLILYRNQTGIPASYNIRTSDMAIYLTFQGFMVIFEPWYAVFNIASLEVYRGWKCYDYLVYCRYRFLQRDTRWKGMEDSIDESMDETVRRLDQMCFSSQYFFMLTLMSNGIIYNVLAFEVWLHAPGGNPSLYSPFSDPGFLLLVIILLCMWVVVEQGCYYLAIFSGLWKIKHTHTDWHINYKDNEGLNIPQWGDIQGASHESYLMNQRITSDTFRHKFLNYNRTWLIQQLPQILTPRTLQHSRPSLINQLQRVISAYRVDDPDDKDDKDIVFGKPVLSVSHKNVIRWWLGKAKHRLKLKKIIDPVIRNARAYQCETCLSTKQLQVEYEVDIDKMAALYDMEYPGEEDFDPFQWRNFWTKHQVHHTTCLACLAKRRDDIREARGALAQPTRGLGFAGGLQDPVHGIMPSNIDYSDDEMDSQGQRGGFGPVAMTAVSKAIALNWYRKAQEKRAEKLAHKKKDWVQADISDDEGDNPNTTWANDALNLTPATTDIALKWLKSARSAVKRSKETTEVIGHVRSPEAGQPGLLSKYSRK